MWSKRLKWDLSGIFFIQSMVNIWKALLGRVAEPETLTAFIKCLDMYLALNASSHVLEDEINADGYPQIDIDVVD